MPILVLVIDVFHFLFNPLFTGKLLPQEDLYLPRQHLSDVAQALKTILVARRQPVLQQYFPARQDQLIEDVPQHRVPRQEIFQQLSLPLICHQLPPGKNPIIYKAL